MPILPAVKCTMVYSLPMRFPSTAPTLRSAQRHPPCWTVREGFGTASARSILKSSPMACTRTASLRRSPRSGTHRDRRISFLCLHPYLNISAHAVLCLAFMRLLSHRVGCTVPLFSFRY